MEKLKMFDEREAEWDAGAEEAARQRPIKGLHRLPNMPGITPDTAKGLKWKSLRYMVGHDKDRRILKHFLRHPLKYGYRLLRSLLRRKPYGGKEGDFFLYGVDSVARFEKKLQDPKSLLVIGFSYCHKPFECPSGRFTGQCIHDPENPVCRQCFIGKSLHLMPEEKVVPVIIPTIHHIGDEIFKAVHGYPNRKVLFLITACELTLEMFGDYGNMVDVKGLGVRLDGRICNTMRAFELSEEGTKPGLTVVLPETQQRILDLLRAFDQNSGATAGKAWPYSDATEA